MKKWIPIVAACLFVSVVTAPGEDAKAIWDKQCAKCHGDNGDGNTKMGKKLKVADYTDAKVQAQMKDEEMFKAIKDGVTVDGKTRMKPAKDVTDADVKALVAFVRGLAK